MTIKEMTKYCKKWQKILDLMDYDLDVSSSLPSDDSELGDCACYLRVNPDKELKIVFSEDISNKAKNWNENTCCHELTHNINHEFRVFVIDLIENHITDEKQKAFLIERTHHIEETQNQHYTRVLMKLGREK